MKLRVGQKLLSAVDGTTLLVVKAPDQDLAVACGGHQMSEQVPAERAAASSEGGGVQLGKRYIADSADVELLCVKPGDHQVTIDGEPVAQKTAKPLPASD